MSPTLIAIDPGVSGGIAVSIGTQTRCHKMPGTQADILTALKSYISGMPELASNCVCYIEQLPKYVGDNVPSSTIFVMAENYGFILGVLQTLGVRTITVTPQAWQKALGLGTKGLKKVAPGAGIEERSAVKRHNQEAKAEWKRKLREHAQRRYPHLAATLATADALLILDYGKMQENYREVAQNTPLTLGLA